MLSRKVKKIKYKYDVEELDDALKIISNFTIEDKKKFLFEVWNDDELIYGSRKLKSKHLNQIKKICGCDSNEIFL